MRLSRSARFRRPVWIPYPEANGDSFAWESHPDTASRGRYPEVVSEELFLVICDQAVSEVVNVEIPTVGESISEVQVGQWLKSEGDWVASGEDLVEIETEKASVQIPAPASGFLQDIVKAADEFAMVGDVIASIRVAERAGVTVPRAGVTVPRAGVTVPRRSSCRPRSVCWKNMGWMPPGCRRPDRVGGY